MEPIQTDFKNSIAVGSVSGTLETQKLMARDMYLFSLCEYSRSEYKYKY